MKIKNIIESLESIASLLENEIPDWVCDELGRYNDTAGKRVDKSIEPYLEPYKPKSSTILYRGLGFDKADGVSVLKKLKTKGNKGDKGVYKTGKIQSWSSSESVAREFMGQHGFGGHRMSGSLGILLKIKANPKDIFAPIANLPKDVLKSCVRFQQDEYLLHPGSYKFEIVDLFGEWPSADDKDPKKAINDLKKKLPSILGSDIKIEKTWNKAPGFSVTFPSIKYKTTPTKRTPSRVLPLGFSFAYEDGELDLTVNSFDQMLRKTKTKVNQIEMAPNKAADFIEKDLPKHLKKFKDDLVAAIKKGKAAA